MGDDGEDFARQPPHDIQAEQFTLAAMLASPSAIDDVAEVLDPDDFYRPAHKVIYRALVALRTAGLDVSVVTLRTELERHGEMKALGGSKHGGEYLLNLYGLPSVGAHAVSHAQIVFDRSIRRRAVEAADRVIQAAFELDRDPADVAATAAARFAEVPAARSGDPAGRVMTAGEFAGLTSVRMDMVINGLLGREDRVIVVGEEGHGKSYLGLQAGFTAAAGLHVFRRQIRFPSRRVLMIDFENPRGEVRDRVDMFGALAGRYESYDPGNALVWSWPQGVDLRKGSDAHMVAEHIRQARPDLVVAGPVYNMVADTGEHSEQVHSTVTRFWNSMRGRYGFALWLEAHPPLQTGRAPRLMRPQGSGIYSRWPEFGIALIPNGEKGVLKVDKFRGHRIRNRPWPLELARHQFHGQDWPWVAHKWPDDAFTQPLDET
jgi:hypothetical protein